MKSQPRASLVFLALALASLAAPALVQAGEPAGGLEIVRIWTSYRDAKSFVGLSEYFHGREAAGRAIILRSQPESRDGFYFTVRLGSNADTGVAAPARVVLHVIAPDAGEPRTFALPLPEGPLRTKLIEVGLTGADWSHGRTLPLAWNMEFVAADGTVLASRKSFLWERPEASGAENR